MIALCLGVSRQAAHKRYAAPQPAPAAEPGAPQPRRGKGARGGQYIPGSPLRPAGRWTEGLSRVPGAASRGVRRG